MERLSLIDVSSEDDMLVSSSCEGFFDPSSSGPPERNFETNYCELETARSPEVGNLGKIYKHIEQMPELSESPEKKRNNSNKYNLRKSLAWDSAFFTSEGVLNPEELATVNGTFRKAETSALPGIPEETRRSGESISTLDSDGLENLEIELFENVRASIQKSLGTSDKALNNKNCGLIKDHKGLNTSCIGLREKAARSSQHKVKFPVEVKRHGLSKQRPDNITKEVPINTKVAGAGTADAKASLKPPRSLPKATLQKVPSKTAPAGNTHKSSTSGSVVNRQPSYKTTEVAGRVASRSIGPPRRIPSLPSGSMPLSSSSSSNHSTLIRSSSDSTKSPLEITKKTRNTNHSSSGSINNKTPLKMNKSRTTSRSSTDLQTCLYPTMKISSISPSSSIDSVASEASSSASTAMKSTHSADSIDAGSPSQSLSLIKGNNLYSSSSQKLHQPIAENKSPSALRDCEHSLKDPTAVQGTSEQASEDLPNTRSKGRYFRPSGLRMPTPKIGYFDAEKNLVRNIDAFSQTGQQPSLLKSTSRVNKPVESDTVKPTKLRYAGSPTKKFAADSPHSHVDNLSSTQRTKPASPTMVQLEPKLPPLEFSRENHNESFINIITDDISECGQLNMESLASKLQPYSTTTVILGQEAGVSREGYSDLDCQSTQSFTQEVADCFQKRRESCEKEHLVILSSEKENIPANNTDNSNRNIQSKDLNASVVELMTEKATVCAGRSKLKTGLFFDSLVAWLLDELYNS